MVFVRPKARILELSITAGAGPYALGGAPDGSYNTFSAFMNNGDVTYIAVIEPGVAFKTGLGTYNSATNQITLSATEESKGTFGSGTKEIIAGPLASSAMLREDISGAIVAGGTSTAYTVASFRKYSSLAELDGAIIAFTPNAINGAGATLSVDGLAAKPLRAAAGLAVGANVLLQGTPYLAVYNNTDGAFYLHCGGGNFGVPLGAGMDFWGLTAPSSAFAFPTGQALSRVAFPALFNLIGTAYGLGSGGDATTFGLPDKRGRVSAMLDAAGAVLSGSFFPNAGTAGTIGGSDGVTLNASQIPAHSHPNTLTDPGHTHTVPALAFTGPQNLQGGSGANIGGTTNTTASSATGITINNANNTGGGNPHSNMQPTIVCNYIMRVL